jgi:hypothetical protein
MKTYTLHVPRGARRGDPEALEEAQTIKDGFSWGAFVFSFLWFFAQRLWIAGLFVLLAVVALSAIVALLDVAPGAALSAELLLMFLIGLEANSLKRWTYARGGFVLADVVGARDTDEAQSRLFARWLAEFGAVRVASGASAAQEAARRNVEPVIGLFPDAERPR